MRRLGIVSILLFSQVSWFMPTVQAQSVTSPDTSTNSAPAANAEPAVDEVLQAVREARAYLRAQLDAASAQPHKAVVVRSKEATLPITLAVWDGTTKQLTYVSAKQAGKAVTVTSGQPWQIRVALENGVNTQFTMVGQPQLHVLAVVHPVFTSIGTTRSPKYSVSDAVYVPYTDFLERPGIVSAGRQYLEQNIAAVYDELRALGVRSRAFPDRSLADAISPVVVKSIIAIEHVGNSVVADGSINDYLAQFYVVLATNENIAYSYAKSTASARGLVQFIPSTYRGLVKARPELALNTVFDQGMSDPYNAIKAEVALLDSSLTILPGALRSQYEDDDLMIGSYLAAIYNGGGTRVLRVIKAWDGDWALSQTSHSTTLKQAIAATKGEIARLKSQLNKKITTAQKKDFQQQLREAQSKLTASQASYKKISTNSLKMETVQYVAKFKAMFKVLLNQTSSI